MDLQGIWSVEANPSHDARLSPKGIDNLLVLARTFCGEGVLYRGANGAPIHLTTNSLVLVPFDHITRQQCVADEWCFWWFHFIIRRMSDIPDIPIGTPITISSPINEYQTFALMVSALRRQDAEHHFMASSALALLFSQWVTLAHSHPAYRHGPTINTIINRMHEKQSDAWTVSEMAEEAHMSECLFRKAFKKVTGQPPKQFYDRIRMESASEMLQQGTHNVAQAAYELGFSSPFHFSNAFRRTFGHSPSEITAREHEALQS